MMRSRNPFGSSATGGDGGAPDNASQIFDAGETDGALCPRGRCCPSMFTWFRSGRLRTTQLLHDLSMLWLIAAPAIVHFVVRPVFRQIPSARERLLAWRGVLRRLLASLLVTSLLALFALTSHVLLRDSAVSFGGELLLVAALAIIVLGVMGVWRGPMQTMEAAIAAADGRLARRQMRRTRDCLLAVGAVGFAYFITTALPGLSAFGGVTVGG